MAEDREILREVWEAKVPVCFQLSSDEIDTLTASEPFYLMVPRQLYFPLVTDKVRKHFAQYIHPNSQNNEMWLEYNGLPIKWHYPIGLWFDLFVAPDLTLPWQITVHFDNLPETKILHCSSKDVVRSHFMSSIKEADALKHKSNVINGMQEKDHHQLWTGFHNDRFDQFWSINQKLMEPNGGEGFRYVPIRFYSSENPMIQRLIKPFDETTGTWVTFEEVLTEVFSRSKLSKVRAIVQGIQIPPETPIQWLSEHMSHPDNFLHVALVRNIDGSELKDNVESIQA